MALSTSPPHAAIPRRADPSWAPLSFAQEGFWFLEQWLPGTPRHHMSMAMRIDGPLHVQALAHAFRRVVERHEILRSAIVERRGAPVQVVRTAGDGTASVLRLVDLSAVDVAPRSPAVMRLIRRAARQPFDLATGPLLRVVLWRVGAVHVLATTMHHIAGDAWSLDLLVREVTMTYTGLRASRPAALPPLPIQYGDYAAWEREPAQEARRATMIDYWVTRLNGVTALDLPADRSRPVVPTFRGASCRWWLAPRDVDPLRSVANRERATLFMLVLAAFAVLLRRYAHQADVAVGSPLSIRQQRETTSLIGPFLNTLVFRMHASSARQFRDFLAHVRDVVIEGLACGQAPFERVVERLRAAGRPRESPLFNVMIAARPAARTGLELPALRTERLMTQEEGAQFDLTLYVGHGPDGLGGMLNYSTELFDASTIDRMQSHLTCLLRAIGEAPGTPLGDLPWLTQPERQQLLADLRGAAAPPPAAAGVHELFTQCTALTPDAIAVVRDDEVVSYAEVERRAHALAAALNAHAIGRGSRVAFCLDRRPPLIVTLLGILKAGACYVPLDPAVPRQRLEAMVTDAQPALLIAETRYASWWRDAGITRCLDVSALIDESVPIGVSHAPQALSATTLAAPGTAVAAAPDDPAYVIYTSGSSGTPKGVVVSHASLLNSCAAVAEATGAGPGDRFLHFAPIGFDVSAFQIFPALTTGATTVLAAPPNELSNADIMRLCEEGLTILDLASAVWQQWVADLETRRRRIPPSVRVFMTGGEATPMTYVRAWARMVDGSSVLVSSYGPTETTVTTMWIGKAALILEAEASEPFLTIPLGRAVRNVSLYVLDDQGELVPPGVMGELSVGGTGVGHGYFNRAGEMADAFRPDPFSLSPGARLYRTGDRVRARGSGVLEFHGRFDQQIKRHGIRIEIGEIERLLRQHPRVREAIVTAPANATETSPLVAYVVPDDPPPSDIELRQYLLRHLPPAVLPDAFCQLAAMPVSANGKIDRRALPTAPLASPAVGAAVAHSQTEHLVIDIWAEVLGRTAIGPDDDFFEIGGHSLSAARVASRLEEAFEVEVPVRALFDASTPRQLARAIDERRRERHGERQGSGLQESGQPPLASVARDGPLALSFAQQGFWLVQQIDPASPIFVNPEILRLRGPLSVPALASALTATVARHEALRTIFISTDGVPRQLVEPPRPVRVPVVDLQAMSFPARDARAARLGRREGRRPFDLTHGPLLRVIVIRLVEGDHVVLCTMHHLAADAWSMYVLMQEVSVGYQAALAGEAPALPALPVQYADYAVWQRARWNDEALDRVVAERRAQFGGTVTALDLPADRPRPGRPAFAGARHRVPIAGELMTALRHASRREGTTMFMSLLAVLKGVLVLCTGQRTIAVAAPAANRTMPSTERLIGLFINHLLLVTRIDDDSTCRELLARVRASTLDAFDRQDLPFEELVRRLWPGRQSSQTPLVRVLFNVVNVPRTALALPGVRVEPPPFGTAHRPRFDLEWTFLEAEDGAMTGSIGYDTELFDAATIEQMAADYVRVLRAFVDAPDQRLSSLASMTDTQASLALAFNEPL